MRSPDNARIAASLDTPRHSRGESRQVRIRLRFTLFRPSAQGRIWFSMWLLSIGTVPSSKNRDNPTHWFRL